MSSPGFKNKRNTPGPAHAYLSLERITLLLQDTDGPVTPRHHLLLVCGIHLRVLPSLPRSVSELQLQLMN